MGAPDEPVREVWRALAGLVAVTSHIRLATLATAVGYRNPAHLAKIAASVDLISRGRLTLGIGAGFFEEEYKLLARDAVALAAKRERLAASGPLLINADRPNDVET